MRCLLALLVVSLPLAGQAREIFIDQQHAAAADTNPGTEAAPLKTISAGVDAAQPGDTIWIKAGDYEDQVTVRKAGTPQQPITISAWKDDRVQWGYRPRPLPVAGDWRAIAGTKCYQITLASDVPADFVPLLNDRPTITFMQDTSPPDDKPNWGSYRKADRTFMYNSGGKDPATLGKWTYSRRPSTYSFVAFAEPTAWWVVRHIEFSWDGGGMYMCGDHCVVEDCFFTHCYREGIFLHGRMDSIRRCNFHRCGSAVVSSGAGTAHILDGGTGTKYATLADIRRDLGWEIHGEVSPYSHETVEQAAAAMGGSVVTYRIPWGKHSGEARPMLAKADLQGVWPAAPTSVDGGSAPAFSWRVADGQRVELPVTPARMADWTASPVSRFPDETGTFSTVAETVPEPRYGRGSIYRMEWSAPTDRRAVTIESIEFVGDGKTVPMLLAITGVTSW